MIAIRHAEENDLPALLALWEELMLYHSSLDPHFAMTSDAGELSLPHLHGRVSSPDSAVFVAESEKLIVGYCIACVREKPPVFMDRRHGYITDIFVRGDSRGKGIGESLFLGAKR